MLITGIRRERKPHQGIRVSFDDGSSLLFSDETFYKSGLGKGDNVTSEQWIAFERAEQQYLGRRSALRYLSYRPRSTQEVLRYLVRKEIPRQIAGTIIADIERLGLIDDEAFAGMFVRDSLRRAHHGPASIRSKLLSRGVSPALIDAALDEHFPTDEQVTLARNVLEQRMRRAQASLRRLTPRQRRARLYAFLLQRGFSARIASRILEEKEDSA